MPALPAEGVLRAAQRWLHLLQRSSLEQAAALIRADPAYTDLTTTQYSTALDWLRETLLVEEARTGLQLAPEARRLDSGHVGQLLFARALEALAPPWLPDADILVRETGDLPQDASSLAEILGLGDTAALLAVRQVHGRIDLAERARVGAAGELGLVNLLEEQWPGSTRHVSLSDDGLGYDVAFTLGVCTWHLEVKTTCRRASLVLFVSRHEHEIALIDPQWRLIVVGLDAQSEIAALATARHDALLARAPYDVDSAARWAAVRYQLTAKDLIAGLRLSDAIPVGEDWCPVLELGLASPQFIFEWMPTLVDMSRKVHGRHFS